MLEYLIIDCGAPLLGLEGFADYILVPIGGEGLVTGVSTLARFLNPMIKVIGVEPANANCVQESLTSRWKHSVRHIRRKSFTRWIGKAIDRRWFRQICDRAALKVQMRRKEQIPVRDCSYIRGRKRDKTMNGKKSRKIICIDIGGTAIKSGIMDENLKFLKTDSVDTPRGGGRIMDAVLERISEYLTVVPNPKAVCISSAGIIDSDRGIVTEANESLIPGYTGMDIAGRVKERFRIPCYVENDVNCAAMAEAYQGAARGYSSVLMLTIGTGIGGAFLEKGRLLKGHTYSACEVGYMHMDGSSFEELAATSVLVKRTTKRLSKNCFEISGKWIFEQAQGGNEICIEEIDRMCDILAKGIANLCYVLNPEIVVIGGGISAQEDYLRPRIEDGLDRYLIPEIRRKTKLGFAKFGNHAGMLGACCAAGVLEGVADRI